MTAWSACGRNVRKSLGKLVGAAPNRDRVPIAVEQWHGHVPGCHVDKCIRPPRVAPCSWRTCIAPDLVPPLRGVGPRSVDRHTRPK